jgi:hypothetical protein
MKTFLSTLVLTFAFILTASAYDPAYENAMKKQIAAIENHPNRRRIPSCCQRIYQNR